MQINSVKSSKEAIENTPVILSSTVAFEDAVQEVSGMDRDENGPHSLWQGLAMHSGKKSKKKEKPKPPKGPTESERLADILARYGNNPQGIPAIHYAILQNDIPAIDLLLKHGASPHTQDFHGANCIYYSIKACNIQQVRRFLKLGVNPNGSPDNDEHNPLRLAIELHKNDIAKELINNGIDLTLNGQYRTDYLQYGCLYNNFEIVKLLVERGARSNNPENLLKTLILQNGQQKEPQELRKFKIEMIDFLIKKNVIDLSKKITYGYDLQKKITPKGNDIRDLERIYPEALAFVLKHGILDAYFPYYNGGNVIGMTPLITLVARSKDYATEMVQLLVDRGFDVKRHDYIEEYNQMNVIHFLVQGTFEDEQKFLKRKELIRQIIYLGTDINFQDRRDKTPLSYAIDPKMIEFLKSLGAR